MERLFLSFVVLIVLASGVADGQAVNSIAPLAFPAELSQANPAVALNEKTPLILIHGWNTGGFAAPPMPGVWSNFLTYFEGNAALSTKYKAYLLSFYSNVTTITTLGRTFRDLLDSAGAAEPAFSNKKVVVIAHSIGGLIARSFMEEYRLNSGVFAGRKGGERVLTLITLATPHHGSPLANGPARDEKAKSAPGVAAIISFFEAYFYASAGLNYNQHNRVELHWDNFDNQLDYTTFAEERNIYLSQALNVDTTFDSRIIAHVGIIPAALNGPGTGAYVLSNGFGSRSDGFVPEFSAGFAAHMVQKRVTWSGYNHSEMVYGKTGSTELFDAIRNDLLMVTGVEDRDPVQPGRFVLEQNYPNPFNPKTMLVYSIPGARENNSEIRIVRLSVYDLLGREVAVLVNEPKEPGTYQLTFDASGLASGAYLYRLRAGSYVVTKKMVLAR